MPLIRAELAPLSSPDLSSKIRIPAGKCSILSSLLPKRSKNAPALCRCSENSIIVRECVRQMLEAETGTPRRSVWQCAHHFWPGLWRRVLAMKAKATRAPRPLKPMPVYQAPL